MATYFGDLGHAAQFVTLCAIDGGLDLDDVGRIVSLQSLPQSLEAGGGNVCNLLISYGLDDLDLNSNITVKFGPGESGPWVEVFRLGWTGDPSTDPPNPGTLIVPFTWPKMPNGQRVTHAWVKGYGEPTITPHLFVGLMWLRKHPEPAGGADGRAPAIN